MESLVRMEHNGDGVVTLWLNRPEKRNALNMALMEQLCLFVEKAQKDPAIRVLVLRGQGKVFCAGLDLEEGQNLDLAERSAKYVARTLECLHFSPLVTIACVQGAALAGGAGLMTACDLVVAEEGARFGYPETRRGLVAALVMPFLLRQVGDRYARELLLLGDLIDAQRALEMGLINRMVPLKELEEQAMILAEQVTLGAPGAIGLTKKLLQVLPPRSIEEDLQVALKDHKEMRHSPEALEGMKAFVEKRAPSWCLAVDS